MTLSEAARLIPHASSSDLLRWIKVGAYGVRLSARKVAGKWQTTGAAVARFLADTAEARQRELEAMWG